MPTVLAAVSRRRFLALAAATGLLGACGGRSTGTTARPSPPPTAGPSSTLGGGFPRTVGRGFATATIPAPPQRVVATADRDQLDVLLAMGVAPVLYGRSDDYATVAPWVDPALVEGLAASDMAGSFEPNLEAIAAAEPDLIVDAWADEAVQSRLSAIAPTIQVKLDNTDSWQAAQRLTGEAIGREDAAEAAIAETEAVVAEQRERLAELAGLSVAVAFVDVAAIVMIPGNEIGGRLFTELGLTVHPTPDGVSGRFSLESVPDLLGDADVIVALDTGAGDDERANAVFQALPAVRAGRFVTLDLDTTTASYQESTLSVRWAAPRIADALLA